MDALFVWIPKTAGHSIQSSLKITRLIGNYDKFHNKGIVTFGHTSITALMEAGVISDKYIKNAFKFCFVRNPYDRALSLYIYLKYRYKDRHLKKTSFEGFCKILKNKNYNKLGLYNHWKLNICNPQYEWIHNKGEIFMDYIGRIEGIDNCYKTLCKELGVEYKPLPHLFKTKHKHYEKYYNNTTKNLIAEAYEIDFNKFGYDK